MFYYFSLYFFFFNDTATTEIYTLSLHDALPISWPAEEVRLYASEELLRNLSRLQKERSLLARAVAALSADPPARHRFLDNARAGGSAMWLIAPTRERAKRLVGLLADYGYSSLRYYGEDGVADLEQDAT